MTDGERMEACAFAMRELEVAEATVDRMIAAHGALARYQWTLAGPLPGVDCEQVDFQVRLSLGEVKSIIGSNRTWVTSKLRALLGADPQRWARTQRVAGRRWWERLLNW